MKVKITHPVRIGVRVMEPGETINLPEDEALTYIGREWATEVAEEPTKVPKQRKVKHGNWPHGK